SLLPYALRDGPQRCGSSNGEIWQTTPHGLVWWSRCDLGDDLGRRLSWVLRWAEEIAGGAKPECKASALKPLDNMAFIAKFAERAALVLQTPVDQVCLTMAVTLSQGGSILTITSKCIPAGEGRAALAESFNRLLSTERSWMGAQSPQGGFAIAVRKEGASIMPDGEHRMVWGGLDNAYVSNWLTSVAHAAAVRTNLVENDDPLHCANGSTFSGRLAKWLAAGLIRTYSKPFQSGGDWDSKLSRGARDWMARNAL